ncbi:AbrB/MazE/SpoVT family DNA-binding domain-containing protein [Halococcus sp. IIIV-5B]|nr:AbrB/MazE/SpoVT family DNA-binding domain-containing protein [Halococcus sp. IIIV-5B]
MSVHEATVTSKGQIPKAVRDRLDLERGEKVSFEVAEDGTVRL